MEMIKMLSRIYLFDSLLSYASVGFTDKKVRYIYFYYHLGTP